MVFHLSFHQIMFVHYLTHLVYSVHKSSCKTKTLYALTLADTHTHTKRCLQHLFVSEKSNKSLMHGYEGEQGSSSMIELDSSNETDRDSFNVTDSLTCVGCEEEMENCQCKHIMATFHQLNHQL